MDSKEAKPVDPQESRSGDDMVKDGGGPLESRSGDDMVKDGGG